MVQASALTVHKSQGGTYDKIVYEYKRGHDQTLVYVTMGRVTSLSGLIITNASGDHTFYHGTDVEHSDARIEYERLENHRLPTITDKCLEFFEGVDEDEITHATLNVQSLKCHKHDVETDSVLPKTRLLALTETWMKNHERIDLQVYRCVNQYVRDDVRSGGVAIYERKGSIFMATPHVLMKCDAEVHRKAVGGEVWRHLCGRDHDQRGEGSRRGFLHLAGSGVET